MKKAEMIITIARKASAAWMELKQYEYYLHVQNFECGETSIKNFRLYCLDNPGHRALLHAWNELEDLCDKLDICYGAMAERDDVIKNNIDQAMRASDRIWVRSLEFARGEEDEEE